MQKVIVRYLADPEAEELLVINPADEMRAKRELAGKAYADDEYRLYWHAFLAAKRAGNQSAGGSFETWIETVAEVEPRLTMRQIDDAVLAGVLDSDAGEALRAKVREQESAEGESLAPRS